jgi:DUF4097 and DUF4098 domain-containing protein YvlB
METFAFLKTMNKQTQQLRLTIVAAAMLAMAFAVPRAQAQSGGDKISVNLSDPSRPAFVKVGLVNGSIIVKGYDGKQVIVEARNRNQERDRETSSGGLKRLNISTTGLSVEEENNEVRISTESYNRAIDVTITVPAHASLKLRAVNDGEIVVTGVDGELDVDNVNGPVTLNNVSGSAVAHALNGKLIATFVHVNQKPMAFSSLNGDIDVTLPADVKANVSLKSDRGDVFSDFDVQLQAAQPQQVVEDGRKDGGKYRVRVDKTVHGTINGGGPEYQFTNFNGGIYIRKAGAGH